MVAGDECASSKDNVLFILAQDQRQRCLSLVISYLESQIELAVKPSSDCNQGQVDTASHATPFHNKCKPRISLSDYAHRIAKFTQASSLCFVMACHYIERIQQFDERYALSQQTAHRLLLCGVLLAVKLTDDKFRSNAYFSKVGGVSKKTLNEMELCMFAKLDFSLHVSKTMAAEQLQLMTMRVSSLKTNDNGVNSKRGTKRISEDVGFGSEDDLPSKLPHDNQHKTILVIADSLGDQIAASSIDNALSEVVHKTESDLHTPSRQVSLGSCAQALRLSETVGSLDASTSARHAPIS